MKKTKLIVALLLAVMMLFTFALVACDPDEPDPAKISATINADGSVDYTYADNTEIRAAIGYDSLYNAISFRTETSTVYLPSGSYINGDLKPTWETLANRLSVTFNDMYTGKNRENEFDYWKNLNYKSATKGNVDVLIGTSEKINEAGRAGNMLNIADYLDYMPNYKAYLEANPIVYLSLIADTTTGDMYMMPYFDGNDDIERFFMMRVDWVAELLDGSTVYTHSNASVNPMNTTVEYEAYMPKTGSVDVEAANAAGTATTTVTKNYDAALAHFKTKSWYTTGTSGNIVDIANAYRLSNGATYDGLIAVLREFIDVAYGNHYGNTRSDLFCGVNSAWDADEIVVLLHCIVGSSYEFNGTANMAGIFTRGTSNDRTYDLVRMAAGLFGVRGLESRKDYLYFDSDGNLCDARQEESAYEAMGRMSAIFQEGLIDPDVGTSGNAQDKIQNNKGFMEYDYVQSQTGYTLADTYANNLFQPVLNPVALWFDGTNTTGTGSSKVDNGVYMRFTESWRSVKSDGAGIVASVEDNPDKLAAILRMFDYMYTWEGKVLMTYGPDEFIETNTDGSWKTIDYNGEEHPQLLSSIVKRSSTADYTVTSGSTTTDYYYFFNSYTGVSGSYSTYARRYIGSTLCVCEKMQSFEFQLTDKNGLAGEAKVSTAIGLGLIKHPELSIQENMWYTSLPTAIATSASDDTAINQLTRLTSGTSYFSQSSTSGHYNLFFNMIKASRSSSDVLTLAVFGSDAAQVIDLNNISTFTSKVAVATSSSGWGASTYLNIVTPAWVNQLAYYNEHVA